PGADDHAARGRRDVGGGGVHPRGPAGLLPHAPGAARACAGALPRAGHAVCEGMMVNLRDEIAEIIQTIAGPWLAADDMLATVREALMSDAAIVAAQRGITSYVWDQANQEEIIHRKRLGATRSGIKEALDSLAGSHSEVDMIEDPGYPEG